ncbi:hypothetical protein P8C59_000563 [Phyllachora maydis]|uniref:Glutamate carboxypeptidase n=1 Tax=Phyllachora maydis TaxID=1825666 RepID=A0AAD9HXG6_9PEZI|nr:hypothetical protein P8C59_000563 [Phyllachora maydis]
MAPPEKSGSNFYDPPPPIPSYDEAVAASGQAAWPPPHSPTDDRTQDEIEGQSLLSAHRPFQMSGSQPRGYRQPTVETDESGNSDDDDDDDDDDSLFDFDGAGADADPEAVHVRREMQQMEMMDPETGTDGAPSRSSSWGKRISFFPLSLSGWRSRFGNWRLPLPRFRIRVGRDRDSVTNDPRRPRGAGGDGEMVDPDRVSGPRWAPLFRLPDGSSRLLVLQLMGRLFAIMLILGFLYLIFMSDIFAGMARRMGSQMFDPESVRMHIQSSVSPQNMRATLQHFSGYAHMAGTEGDYALAIDTKNLFEEYGLEGVAVDEYQVYLNYPHKDGRAVEILDADGKPVWKALLEEEELGGETAGRQTYAFHGHSKAGDVRGPLIYANYGSREDFKALHDSGIDTHGAIALVRYYGTEGDRALKIKAAELAGFAGCLIYGDPADDGFVRGETAPKGRFMPADGVQRGSVSLMPWVVGDVLTPGWGSKPNMPRMKVGQTPGLVKIPSLPLAWRDAQVLLQHIRGMGQKVPTGWAGGVPDMGAWWTGNLSSPVVRLRNEQDENEKQAIWNVYGRIDGVEQGDKRIMIGNHRDAWGFGAADPGSGTAVMLEVARIFGGLLQRGWRPLRTIEFMSWDAEEYNLIGSTEYVEQNDAALREHGLAYINLDTAVTGDTFRAAGSPVFRKLLLQVLHRVGDPHLNASLLDLWDRRGGRLDGLGAGSDYVAFQDIVGTSSLDLRFASDEDDRAPARAKAFPYHSSHDNFAWMDRVGDPGFVYHGLLAQVLGLLVVELADRPVLPFDMAAYAEALPRWATALADWADGKSAKRPAAPPPPPPDLGPVRAAADEAAKRLREFEKWERVWENSVVQANGWEPAGLGKQRCEYNARMAAFESDLLDAEGIPGRKQFKHVVFGPALWSGYDAAYFPGVRDTVAAGDWAVANRTATRVAATLRAAAANLVMG